MAQTVEQQLPDKKYKCELIYAYNYTKYGVDKSDEMICFYEVERKSRRWPVTFLLRNLQKALLNSYILYKETTTKPIARLRFYVKVFEALVNPQRLKRTLPVSLVNTEEGCKIGNN